MKFKIYYETDDGNDDFYIIEGSNMKEITEQNDLEFKKRNLTMEKNNLYSEKIED